MRVQAVAPRDRSWSRPFDIALALGAILLLSPLFVFIAALILVVDGRPVLFRQQRIGKSGKPFVIWKFRSMRGGTPGLSITALNDRRVTRVGAWLRTLKLDELPQLVNVLQGSMSFIGPRPEVPEYVVVDNDVWRKVLEVRPGITDLASLAFRDEEAILASAPDRDAYYRSVILPEKLRLNLRHQEARSFMRDLKLLWLTTRYSFFPFGFDRERIMKSLGF